MPELFGLKYKDLYDYSYKTHGIRRIDIDVELTIDDLYDLGCVAIKNYIKYGDKNISFFAVSQIKELEEYIVCVNADDEAIEYECLCSKLIPFAGVDMINKFIEYEHDRVEQFGRELLSNA